MADQLAPGYDYVVVWDTSAGEPGRVTPFDLTRSVIEAGSGQITVTENSITGKVSIDLNAGALVAATRQVIAGDGVTGGGSLSSDVTLSADIIGLTQESSVDTANDLVMIHDSSAGTLRAATPDNLTGGVTATVPIGAIA